MSKEVLSSTVLVPTNMGVVAFKTTLLSGHDVEDVVATKARSQARLLQMINLGKETNQNATLPQGTIKSSYVGNEEEE